MRSRDVRRRILSDHAGIRIMVANLEAIAVRLQSGGEQLSEPLRRMCLAALLRDDMRQEAAAFSDPKFLWDEGGTIHQLSG